MGKSFLVAELFVEVMDKRDSDQRLIAEHSVENFIKITKNAGAVGVLVDVDDCPSDVNGKHIVAAALFGKGEGPLSDTVAVASRIGDIVSNALATTIALKAVGMVAEFTIRYSTLEELAKITQATNVAKQEQTKREQVLVELISKTVHPSSAGLN